MPDFSRLISRLAIVLGVFGGVVLAIALAVLGHGWWSLLAIPVTPAVLWVPARWLETP